ncbi:MAG: hypothetical protein KGQ83_09410, partial [Planctomycetes bacterium]|nr:hypothetical protein [Planctomycetota bacterium]
TRKKEDAPNAARGGGIRWIRRYVLIISQYSRILQFLKNPACAAGFFIESPIRWVWVIDGTNLYFLGKYKPLHSKLKSVILTPTT